MEDTNPNYPQSLNHAFTLTVCLWVGHFGKLKISIHFFLKSFLKPSLEPNIPTKDKRNWHLVSGYDLLHVDVFSLPLVYEHTPGHNVSNNHDPLDQKLKYCLKRSHMWYYHPKMPLLSTFPSTPMEEQTLSFIDITPEVAH